MQVRVELFSQWLKLSDAKPLEACIHDVLGHVHSLLDFHEVPLELFDILDAVKFDLLAEVIAHLQVVPDIKQVLRKLRDGELSRRVDLLLVSLDRVIVLRQLIY
jgi:hypothetical protein